MYIKCYVVRVITLSVSITVNVLGQSEARITNGPMRIHIALFKTYVNNNKRCKQFAVQP